MFCQLSRGLKWGQSEFFHCVRHLFIVCGRSYLISYLCSCRSESFFFLLGTERECGCRRVGQPASNMTRICSLEHRWSSGRIRPCHGRDPGSIPGRCSLDATNKRPCPIFCHCAGRDHSLRTVPSSSYFQCRAHSARAERMWREVVALPEDMYSAPLVTCKALRSVIV